VIKKMPMHKNVILILITLYFAALSLQRASANSYTLTHLVRETMQAYFDRDKGSPFTVKALLKGKLSKEYDKRAGVFVTLSANGHTRACWGSVYPTHSNLAESTVYATIGALSKDYRYKPIKAKELETLKTQVTIIDSIEPIAGINGQNPMRDGLMLRSGHKAAVLLPGEARDAYYQLICCKLKAGLNKGEPYQLYRLKAEIYE
jgi:AMMECR1 domain-containing protein